MLVREHYNQYKLLKYSPHHLTPIDQSTYISDTFATHEVYMQHDKLQI